MAKLDVVIPAVEVEVNGVKYRKVDRKAQAGDIVKMTEGGKDVTKGAFYEVAAAAGYSVFRDDDDDSRILGVWSHDVYERVMVPMKTSRLAVGDFAKVVDASGDGSAKVGDVGVVVNDNWGGAGLGNLTVIEVETFDGRKIGMFASRFVRATEAEVEAAKEEAARKDEDAKWAKIGRKVNEFKRGDIVKCIGRAADTAGYGEVQDDSSANRVKIYYPTLGRCTEPFDIITLIVPVEQRFDTKEAA